MAEQISKLSPHRDLQCYFLTPSAIASMSNASASGFILSGKWRQQFDWAVVEWNRDNVFEHPALRNLPDGDLSGLKLSYQEERIGCIPIESNLVPIVDWNDLRIWTDDSGATPYKVSLWPSQAVPVEGAYTAASATMTLTSSPGIGKRIGLAWLEMHHYYTVGPSDSLSDMAKGLAQDILSNTDFTASSQNNSVTISWKSGPNFSALRGANGNRVCVYGFAENGAECWLNPAANFSGGQFPTKYQVTIDFGQLKQQGIPTERVRKLRWTWSADLQPASFVQTEFQVKISDWTVSGSNAIYQVAGPGSFRVEDTDSLVTYSGNWSTQAGNYSGSRIHLSTSANAACSINYAAGAEHDLYLGTRLLSSGANIAVSVDGTAQTSLNTQLSGEDILIRSKLGTFQAGQHAVTLTHAGPDESPVYFDFLEIAYASNNLPDFDSQPHLALATDWDTYHSQSLAAERTAWLINKLGFKGRVNHYVGALWFYELVRPGMTYASLSLSVVPVEGSGSVKLNIATSQNTTATAINHLILPDDTAASVAQALSALINTGTNLLWASVSGNELILTARSLGTGGNGIWVQADPENQGFTLSAASNMLSGGVDGTPSTLNQSEPLNATLLAASDFWVTDTTASPRLNRAARDWHLAFFTALRGYGIDCVASFSTELMNADPSAQAGIAQVYPDGTPVVLNTPAIQTNFSPNSLQYWKQVYLDMAALQASAGMIPYLQSGEVQWWYFPREVWNAGQNSNVIVGMPFYDQYTQQEYQNAFGTRIPVIADTSVDVTPYLATCQFLAGLIGSHTAAIRGALQMQFPGTRYEVLYPTDVNAAPLNQIFNYPHDWNAANLSCLKTESFIYTGSSNLDQSAQSMSVSAAKGFGASARSHLVGIGDSHVAWMKEVNLAQSTGMESVVLFALDQYCLIGYAAPPFLRSATSQRQA